MAVNQVSQPYNWTFRRVVWATFVLVSLIPGFWLLYRFNQVIFILIIAIMSAFFVILFLSIYWRMNQNHFERLWLSLLLAEGRKHARDI